MTGFFWGIDPMGLREWIIILAILLMAVVAFDAWRRVRRQRRYHGSWVKPSGTESLHEDHGTARVSRVQGNQSRTEPSFDDVTEVSADDQGYGASEDISAVDDSLEGPSFEPQPIPSDRVNAGPTVHQGDRQKTDRQRATPETGAPQAQGVQRRPLDLSRKVPVLVDSLETETDSEQESEFAAADETQYEFDLQPADPASPRTPDQSTDHDSDKYGTGFDALDDAEPDPNSRNEDLTVDPDEDESPASGIVASRGSPAVDSTVDAEDDWEEEEIEDPVLAEAESRQLNDEEAGEQLLSEPEAVLVVTVLAREGTTFEGANLLSILLACGMRFGNMNIFHATDDHGRLQYSAANAFNPGTFDLDNVEHFETRGVTFFLQLPCQGSPMDAFEAMMHSANTLATHLDGDVFDESRSVMTTQTLTHYRERIREHQRAQLMKRA